MTLSRRLFFFLCMALLITTIAAFAADPAKARKRLERDGNEFTVEGFLKEIMYGEPKKVELYLEAGMSPDAADEEGNSALQRAAEDDSERVLVILLKAKPKLDPKNNSGDTPLCRAASSERPKNVDLLIKAGASVNVNCAFRNMTPLHQAAREGDAASVSLLLAAGATVDAREDYNETPLLIAANKDSLAAVSALIKAGADVNTKGNSGNTPLHEAVGSDNAEIAKALLDAGADPNPKNAAGRTPLLEAARFGRQKVLPVLLAGGADPKMKSDGTTPLAAAREEGKKEIIDLLENAKPVAPRTPAAITATPPAGPPPNAADARAQLKKIGITTIDADTLFGRVEARDVRAVTLLIAAGAKTNARNDVGRTPLWEAIENDDVAMVKALIAAGADANDPGKAARKEFEYGQTLVMLAVDRDSPELLAPLIAAGADVNKVAAYAMTALMNAAMQGKVEQVKMLIEAKADVNAVDTNGTPVIYSAVQGGNVDVLRMLLAAGARVGPSKKLLLEAAETNPEMKAMLTSAAAKEPAGSKAAAKPKAPPAPEYEMPSFPKPVTLAFGKKPVTAKQVYDALLPIARKWQPDAELTDLGTLSTGLLDTNGRSAHWNVHFYSRSAQKVNLMSVDDGILISVPQPSNELRIVNVSETTILDTARLNEIAENAGASAYASRATRPTAGLLHNPKGGDTWYFNYDDLVTGKNILTIVIDANSGKVLFKDGK